MENLVKSISEVVEEYKKFCIPDLQRSYVWGEIQWEQLWEDICRVYYSVSEKEQHFLGCLVLKKKQNVYDVIDGQQRLTTVKILMDYLYDLMRYKGKSCCGDFIEIKSIHVNKQEHIIEDADDSKGEVYAAAYNFFAEKYYMHEQTMELERLINVIKHRLFLVVKIVDKNENEYQIFESINATGKPLIFSDLILNYLCEHGSDNQNIKCRWNHIINSLSTNELLVTEKGIDATKIEEIEDENDIAEEENNEDVENDENDEKRKEDSADNSVAKTNPLKLKKFLNALHCLTLPKTESMPESIDAFEHVFIRLKRSFYREDENKEIDSDFILNEMEKWLVHYVSYLCPNKNDKYKQNSELKYLSILGSSNLIPVVMRTLEKYKDNEDDCRKILYGLVCCQIVKYVYFERDNTREMERKSILADYLYEYTNKDLDKYLCYLVDFKKLQEGLSKDEQYFNEKKYEKIELWKVPFHKRVCKFLLMFGCDINSIENMNDIHADYFVLPNERTEKGELKYKVCGYDDKSIRELWNVVIKNGLSETIEEKQKNGEENVKRLELILKNIKKYCEKCFGLKENRCNEGYFVKFELENNQFVSVLSCTTGVEEVEKDKTGTNCYFGFIKKEEKYAFCLYPKGYFGNNNTMEYYLDGNVVGGENEKEKALIAFKNKMSEKIGSEYIREFVHSIIAEEESPSNIIFLTKDVYNKFKNLPKSTRKRWESYFHDIDKDGIAINLNTGVDTITKNVRKIYQKYVNDYSKNIESAEIGFWFKMRRPEMHYIQGKRRLTQYRNIADLRRYESFILELDTKDVDSKNRISSTNSMNPIDEKDRFFECERKTFQDINNKKFKIPEYQREYVWEKNNWENLLKSIKNNTSLDLGMIILYKNGDNYFVVDGQQRLTTLFILLNSLGQRNDSLNEMVVEKTNKAACQNYMNDFVKNLGNQKNSFLEKVKQIQLCVLTIKNGTDSNYQYRVFASVNGKGKQLTVEEKVKNYLIEKIGGSKERLNGIKRIVSQKGFIKAYTELQEKEHVSEKMLFEKFKLHINLLFDSYKEKKKEETYAVLYRYCRIYALLKWENVKSTANNKEVCNAVKEFWIWLKLYQHLKVDTADALILSILEKNIKDIVSLKNLSVKEEEREKIGVAAELLKKIDMIYFLLYTDDINGNGKKSINSKFPKMIGADDISISMKIKKENFEIIELKDIIDDPVLYSLIETKDDSIYETLWNKIIETDLTRSMRVNVSRFLILILEIWNGLDTNIAFSLLTEKEQNIQKLARYDVEHIFPANPEEEFKNLNKPQYLYTLQNVCLLERSINRSKRLSNGMMAVKNTKTKDAKSKLLYLQDNENYKTAEKKYNESVLTFPQMFYTYTREGCIEKLNYIVEIDANEPSKGYYYSDECAKNRISSIKNNIMKNEKETSLKKMMSSVLKNIEAE